MNLNTERRAIDAVIEYESAAGRTAVRAPYGSGYDMDSRAPDGVTRHIEIKSTRRAALTSRWLEPKEFAQLEADPAFHLYAVVTCDDTPRIIEFDRDALMQRYAGPITKHALRFPSSDFRP